MRRGMLRHEYGAEVVHRNNLVVLQRPCHSESARGGRRIRINHMAEYYVYIMTNPARTLYTGVTNDLQRRVYEHKHKLASGFTKKYDLTDLAYYEATSDVRSAIRREKQIKGWLRSKKVALIESANPKWRDLADGWYDTGPDSSSARGGLRVTEPATVILSPPRPTQNPRPFATAQGDRRSRPT